MNFSHVARPLLLAGLVILGGSTPACAQPNLVVNGDFETGDLTGWTVTGGANPPGYRWGGPQRQLWGCRICGSD